MSNQRLKLKKFYFTFGPAHIAPLVGINNLLPYYVVIEAFDSNQATNIMFAARKSSWSFSYRSATKAGVTAYNLKQLTLSDVMLKDECFL